MIRKGMIFLMVFALLLPLAAGAEEEENIDAEEFGITGTVIQSLVQRNGYVFLMEENGARFARLAIPSGEGEWEVLSTGALPADAHLDTFHSSPDGITILWGDDRYMDYADCGDHDYRLAYVEAEDRYEVEPYCIRKLDSDGQIEECRRGFLRSGSLTDLSAETFPSSFEMAAQELDRTGLAVVNNPDESDRLHLRKEPNKASDSLGRFYNGTMVRVNETDGEWCKVEVGYRQPLTGWMLKKYLAFEDDMDGVGDAFPDLSLSEDLDDENLYAYADAACTVQAFEIGNGARVTGAVVSRGETLAWVVSTWAGDVGYVPADWYTEGNG